MERLTQVMIIACFFFSTSLRAADESTSNDAFAAGSIAFADEDYLRALSNFQAAQDLGLDGPAIHYNIAVCHYKLGDYQAADAAFRLVSDDYPSMRPLAEYNLGLVAMRQNRDGDARIYFEEARSSSSDDKIIRLSDLMLERLDPTPEPRSWFSMINAQLGHDDNVSLIADVGLPFGESAASDFTEIFGVVSGPLSSQSHLRFDASLYSVRYNDVQGFDQNAVRLGGVYQWRWGGWQTEAGPYINHSALDGNGFEQDLGAGISLKRAISDRTFFSARYEHDEIDEIESQFAFVSGSRDRLRFMLQKRSSKAITSIGYVFEQNDRQEPSVSPTRNRFFARLRYLIRANWLIDLEGSFRASSYSDLPEQRDEDLTEIAIAVSRTFQSGWQITGGYRWSDNDSNDAIYSYDRARTSLGLNKAF
jgi:tetratricopeptide (TPR) repeat protein